MMWRAPSLHTRRYEKCYNFNISLLILIIIEINLSYLLNYIMKYFRALNFHWKMYCCDCLRNIKSYIIFTQLRCLLLYDWKNTKCIHINFNSFTVQNINALSNSVTQNQSELCACTSYMLVIKHRTKTKNQNKANKQTTTKSIINQ